MRKANNTLAMIVEENKKISIEHTVDNSLTV